MIDTLCVIFMTAYFKHSDGNYSPIPEDTTRVEIKTKEFRTLLFKLDNGKWFGNVDGKIFYSSLDDYRKLLCDIADKTPLPEKAYKERSVLLYD
tara:strand:+ start:165 stop:446 length:282 start_codon:yes stop_codon:yes gene_type:complete